MIIKMPLKFKISLIAILLIFTNNGLTEDPSVYLLPKSFFPISNYIKLMIKSQESTFTGQTRIKVKCLKETSELVIHGVDLEIDSFRINHLNNEQDIGIDDSDRSNSEALIKDGNLIRVLHNNFDF